MFKTDKTFFDEFAKMATGAVGAVAGIREQIGTEIKAQVSRFVVEMDFVPREDFEIVEAMAREARLQNEKLASRISALEEKLGLANKPAAAKKAAAKKGTAKKATTKKSAAKSVKTASKPKKS